MAAKQEGVGRAWIRALKTEPLERLYIFYGEETYRRETAVGMIRRRLSPEGGFDWDTVELRGRSVTADIIAEAVSTPPVSAERKLVLVREFDPLKNDITELASALSEDVCLIFDMEDPAWKPDKRTKAYKELSKYGFFAEFNTASPEELEGFIRRCFKDRGHSIDRPEVEYLIFLCTNLMAGLLNEIEKIAAYAHGERITREDIDAVASRAVESRIFEMCDELATNHTGRALTMLSDLEISREPAIAVTAVIARQFRQLYAARLALESGRDRAAIMQLTGLRFPYHANRLIDSARRMPLPLLRYALIACMEADAELKSSRAADYDTVRMLIMRYAAKAAEV
ncbi:MAG: DNA polymerase III subunit delta [Clostridiaceae bacterium]|nr:DNA polymerase III subunit delta [Clostridiaceae bacterium]